MGTNHGGVNFGRRSPPIGGQFSTLNNRLRGVGRVGLGPSRPRCLGPRRVAFDRAGVGSGIGRRGSAVGGGLARRPGRGRCLRSRGQAPGGVWLWAAPARGPRGAYALCGPLGSGRRRRAHISHRRAMERRARVRAGARGQPRRRKRRHHRNPQRFISLVAVACAMQSDGPRAPSGQGFHSNWGPEWTLIHTVRISWLRHGIPPSGGRGRRTLAERPGQTPRRAAFTGACRPQTGRSRRCPNTGKRRAITLVED